MKKILGSRGIKILLVLLGGGLLGVGITMIAQYSSQKSHDAQSVVEAQETPQVGFDEVLGKLRDSFALQHDELAIVIRVTEQMLYLVKDGTTLASYPISGSAYGIGSRAGSNKTPLGTHRISEMFGDGAPLGTVFRSRVNTREVAKIYTDDTDVEDDLVTTRIMWLDGQEPGVNKGPGIDSHSRYIYIHGTQEEGLIGRPASHGCIRMKNQDVIELFEQVQIGTLVEILE
jgi:lipoprotein-anchoring transpeptidase ErfK/SrfK